jgi:WD40 repeat protein
MARIFLSHSSKNNAAAIALRDWIIDGGWDDHPFLDLDPARGIAAGERWERALHEAADRCEVVLFLVSRDWLKSDWCVKEFNLAQKLNKRLFGILIDDLPKSDLPASLTTTWQVVNLASGNDHFLIPTKLPDLSNEEYVTFSRSGLARLKAGLDRAGLDPRFFAWPPENEPDRPPYPGLRPLEAEDAGIFFGREAPTVVALDRLRGLREAAPPRLLMILGASGAGKSSFLRAGLIPRLARDDANFLPLPIIRPETAVITGKSGLIRSLQEAFKARGLPLNRADIATAVNAGATELLPLLDRLAEKARAPEFPGGARPAAPSLVLSIDQAEELFSAEGAEDAQTFLALLKGLVLAGAPSLMVLFTIRSNSYERLQTAKALEGVRQETFGLLPMPRGAYQTIIEGPAQRLDDSKLLKIEPALTQALLTDIEAGGGKDALPLLAFTLERLYREYAADGDLLVKEYEALGRIGGAIQAAVEAALKAADSDPTVPKDPSARLALLRRALIPALASIDRETGEPRRRVAHLSEIPGEARGLINCLVEARLLATDSVPDTGETIIEPTHEALLRQWDALQGWLKEDSAALLMLDGVQQAARDWEAKGRSGDWLSHSAGRLENAERLRQREDFARLLTPTELAYLEECRAQDNERRNRELEEARKLAQQTDAALRNETVSLAALSNLALERGQPADAVRLALAAWPGERGDKRPQMRRVINALSSALPLHHERLRLEGHGYYVNSAAFSPDGARIVTASVDTSTARVWDASTGAVLAELKGHGGGVSSAAFSPDGGRIVTASDDKIARIWNAGTGAVLKELKGHGGGVSSAAFSPDGGRIVTASEQDNTARIWDARTGALLAKLKGHGSSVNSAAFSPDGGRIVTAFDDNTARIWDAATGAVLTELEGHEGRVSSAAFSLDGGRIVTASDDKTARIWEAATGAVLTELEGHGGGVNSASFSPDGGRIVTASLDTTARIWDARTGGVLTELKGHEGGVFSAAFSPDGGRIVTASYDARIWDASTVAVLAELKGHGGGVFSAAFSPDGGRIVTASDDKTARTWDATTGAVLKKLNGHGGEVNSASFSPDGGRIVTASLDTTARIWDARTGGVLTELKGHEGGVFSAAFSPDGGRIVTASDDKTARIWDATTGDVLKKLKGHGGGVNSAAFSPDGAGIVTASSDGTARIWDATTGAVLAELKGHGGGVHSAAFSPDGARIVTASVDTTTARVWDASTVTVLTELMGHEGGVFSAAFSPDGGRIVTASLDTTARIWDARTGGVLTELKGHEGFVFSAAFSPDGERIVTACLQDNTARIWDISTLEKGDAFSVACERLGNNTDLTDLAKRYGLAELKPICGANPPNPVDWSKVLD